MKKPASRKRRKHTGDLVTDDLRSLVVDLEAVRRQAEALGIFTGDRELLQCHVCGLMEDVGMYGLLMTNRNSDPIEDSGLRFEALDEGRWQCPACGAVVEERK